eukprot:5766381-Pleurochrysis_carterae.AAC.2
MEELTRRHSPRGEKPARDERAPSLHCLARRGKRGQPACRPDFACRITLALARGDIAPIYHERALSCCGVG